ncbi:hypothetical protein TNCV_1202401 [Trichonephila clavipes]|nr:hypothetical protein TNCV_1202401 [Trichonephila clavipes]
MRPTARLCSESSILFLEVIETHALKDEASEFGKQTGKLKRKYWWKNCKYGPSLWSPKKTKLVMVHSR